MDFLKEIFWNSNKSKEDSEPPKTSEFPKRFKFKLANNDEVKLGLDEDECLTIIYIHNLDFCEYGLIMTKETFVSQMRITPLLFLEQLNKEKISIALISSSDTEVTLEVKFFDVVENIILQVLPQSIELCKKRITKLVNKVKELNEQIEQLRGGVNKSEDVEK